MGFLFVPTAPVHTSANHPTNWFSSAPAGVTMTDWCPEGPSLFFLPILFVFSHRPRLSRRPFAVSRALLPNSQEQQVNKMADFSMQGGWGWSRILTLIPARRLAWKAFCPLWQLDVSMGLNRLTHIKWGNPHCWQRSRVGEVAPGAAGSALGLSPRGISRA